MFDRRYPPESGRSDAHVHFDITQSWEVLDGKGKVVLDGELRGLESGDLLDIETGVEHQDIHNPYGEPLTLRWTVEPVNEFVESFAGCYTHYLTRDQLNDQDEFTPLR